MTASEGKALIVGLVVVCGAALGATLWRHQHPDAPTIAQLAGPLAPATQTPPRVPKPQEAARPRDTAKLEAPAAQPEAAPPMVPDLAPAPPRSEPAAGAGEPPHFDVVRVEPTGDAVIAGKGDPNAKVELLAGGKVIAETKADPSGHFVILPTALAPGSYDLTLRQSDDGKTPLASTQSVAVAVPEKGGHVVVAMAEPGKPTKIIAGPPEPPSIAAAPPAAPVALAKPETEVTPPAAVKPPGAGLAIRSVELENGNGFFASGTAAPGTRVQIYLNGTHLAGIVAGPDGQWSVTLKKGLTGGHYAVRADANGESTDVTARVEVPFDVPVAMAQKAAAAPVAGQEPTAQVAVSPEPAAAPPLVPATPASAPPPSALVAAASPAESQPASVQGSSANAIIEQVETALVVPGDNLWNISRARLGFGKRFTQIYAANVSQIRDPRLIYPGQVFVVPPK